MALGGLAHFVGDAGFREEGHAKAEAGLKFHHKGRLEADVNTGHGRNAPGTQGDFLQGHFALKVDGQRNLQRNTQIHIFPVGGGIVLKLCRGGDFQSALHAGFADLDLVQQERQLGLVLQASVGIGTAAGCIAAAAVALAQILDALVAAGFVHFHIRTAAFVFDLDVGEDFFHFHVRTLDGDGGAVHGKGVHLDDQKIVISIGTGENIPFLKILHRFIRVADDVKELFIVGTDDDVDCGGGFCTDSVLFKDQEVGILPVIQIHDQVCVIVIDGGIQQFLHFPGVHGGIVGIAQGR